MDPNALSGGGAQAPTPTPIIENPATPTPAPTPAAPTPTPDPSAPTPTPTPTDPRLTDFKIREEYKDKPWAAKIKSEEDLYKQIDNLDKLAGKKAIAPDFEKATPKEIEDYYAALRPADKSAYQFDEGTPDEVKGVYADVLHKNGIPAYVGNNLIKEIQQVEKAQLEMLYDKAGFDKELEKSFGASFKETGGEVGRNLKVNLNADDQALLTKLPNEFLGLVYRLTNNLHKAYGASESGAAANNPSVVPPVDIEKVRKDLRVQIADIDKRPHQAEEKQGLIEKLNATYVTTKR